MLDVTDPDVRDAVGIEEGELVRVLARIRFPGAAVDRIGQVYAALVALGRRFRGRR